MCVAQFNQRKEVNGMGESCGTKKEEKSSCGTAKEEKSTCGTAKEEKKSCCG
jgi:hypothetical protein